MIRKLLPAVTLACLTSSIILAASGCAAVKREFLSQASPGPGIVSTNGPLSVTPPITEQLNAVAPIVEAAVPAPWGGLIAAAMNLLATGAAGFATFHARNASASSAAAAKSASAAATASASTPPV